MYKQSVDDDGGRSDEHISSSSKKETPSSATLDTSPHRRSKSFDSYRDSESVIITPFKGGARIRTRVTDSDFSS